MFKLTGPAMVRPASSNKWKAPLEYLASAALFSSEIIKICCLFVRLEEGIELLCSTGRYPEAAFMARTYLPSHVSK